LPGSKSLTRLNIFPKQSGKKTYWALVKNALDVVEGTLVHYMKRNQQQNKSYCYTDEVQDSKRAELDYKWWKQ
jgi:23S rRNA pseudouridine1911/1915/1917 synthase